MADGDDAQGEPHDPDDPSGEDRTPDEPQREHSDETVTVTVSHGERTEELTVAVGTALRDALLAADISPHARAARRLNCGGRGLCATCGVRIAEAPAPEHWHDRLADRFGYPRLSCQVRVTGELHVEIPDKLVWGGRE